MRRPAKPKKSIIEPRKLPRQERALATVDAILEATAQVLRTIGYDALTTNKVAHAAGVSVGSVYQYYPGKDALLIALMLRVAEKQRAALFASLARVEGAPIQDAVDAVVTTMMALGDADPRLSAVLTSQIPRAGDLAVVMAYNEENVAKPLHAYLERRKDELAVEDLKAATFLLTHSILPLLQRVATSRPPPEERRAIFRELRAMLVGYLTTKRRLRA